MRQSTNHLFLIEPADFYDNPQTRELLKPEVQWEIEGSFDMTAARVSHADAGRST